VENHTHENIYCGERLTVANREGNALTIINRNALIKDNNQNALISSSPKTGEVEEEKEKQSSTYENITLSQFELFWEIYPRKVSQGKALMEWKKICAQPARGRPTWRQIRYAVLKQSKTPQWQNVIYIPHPSTWLHQCRWLDDPLQMNGQQEMQPQVQNTIGFKEEGKTYRETDLVM